MSTQELSKINSLLRLQPYGTVFLSSWLAEQGYSLDLLKKYRKSNWLESIGTGAMKRSGESLTLEGALYSLQNQLRLSVHIGGKSSLALQGKAHYLDIGKRHVHLFSGLDEVLPKWFKEYEWDAEIFHHRSDFLPKDIGLTKSEYRDFEINISNTARAMMECLYLAPQKQDLTECYELMEGLNNLRPKVVQELLESCNSIKVKRLFLFMAEKANHGWVKHLKPELIDLGNGKRSIVENGKYVPKYEITVPANLMFNE